MCHWILKVRRKESKKVRRTEEKKINLGWEQETHRSCLPRGLCWGFVWSGNPSLVFAVIAMIASPHRPASPAEQRRTPNVIHQTPTTQDEPINDQ